MAPLQITNPRERLLVRLADMVTAPLSWRPKPAMPAAVDRILLVRLERIGDLLMTLEAVADARRAWPRAAIDLAVGSWNVDLARMIPGVRTVHSADVPWLSRGERPTSWSMLVGEGRRWRQARYDLVVNFEPDIRTNGLAWLTAAPARVGYGSGGGGSFLTRQATYDQTVHGSTNARRLIALAAGTAVPTTDREGPRLAVPADAATRAIERLGRAARPWIGVHVSGGRESKQWHLDRFAAVARTLAAKTGGTIVLTGGPADVAMVDRVRDQIADVTHVSVAGDGPLPELVSLVSVLDLVVTGDTGPMHVAGAVGTPVVALFGPSDPIRYGPLSRHERIVRIDLPCSPCGQVRLPPERCRGHVPDCMDGITVDVVVGHALDLLAESSKRRRSALA